MSVRKVALDDFANERGLNRLDLLEIDVEGADLDVLGGAERLIRHLRPMLMVEREPDWLLAHGERPEALLAFVEELGYDYCFVNPVAFFRARRPRPVSGAAISSAHLQLPSTLTASGMRERRGDPPVGRAMMKALSVIILTYNEERNLLACLDSIRSLDAEIFVIDSGSTDATVSIARDAGCEVVEHPFENYARQRNWSFDNLPVRTPWTLCLDADERLTAELVEEIKETLMQPEHKYDGYMLRKRTIFMGRWIKHGGQYPSYHLRLFRSGRGRCEDRLYDQHFIVAGSVGALRKDYIDVITSDLSTFTLRHNRWADLEAEEILTSMTSAAQASSAAQDAVVVARLSGTAIELKRFLRARVYQRFPLLLRPFLFWIYGYIVRLGFLDGVEGLIFHTLQRFWFRFLVDAKIWEIKRAARSDSKPFDG